MVAGTSACGRKDQSTRIAVVSCDELSNLIGLSNWKNPENSASLLRVADDSMEALVALFREGDHLEGSKLDAAVTLLIRLGTKSILPLVDDLDNPDWGVSFAARHALETIASIHSRELDDPENVVQATALALTRGEAVSLPAVETCLVNVRESSKWWVRASASMLVSLAMKQGLLQTRSDWEAKLLSDEDSRVRCRASGRLLGRDTCTSRRHCR
jgi:HEAT repeat protein